MRGTTSGSTGVYKLMRLNLRRAAKRRQPQRERLPLYVPKLPDSVWSADFMSDALLCGRRYRLVVGGRLKGNAAGTRGSSQEGNQAVVVTDAVCEPKSLRTAICMLHQRHVETLRDINGDPCSGRARISDASHRRCPPKVVEKPEDAGAGDGWLAFRMYYGPEFLGEAFTQWAKNAGMAIQYIQPGKPNQNAYIERFNRTLRNELLDQHLFVRLADVREATYWWMLEYNEERPHDSLGDLTPIEYAITARNSGSELSS